MANGFVDVILFSWKVVNVLERVSRATYCLNLVTRTGVPSLKLPGTRGDAQRQDSRAST